MPSIDVAYASAIQAAYTIGMRDGITAALDHLPAGIRETAAQAMIADNTAGEAWVTNATLDEIAEVQNGIVEMLENVEASKN